MMPCTLTAFGIATLMAAANTIPALHAAQVTVGLPYQITQGTDRCFATAALSDGQVAVLAYKLQQDRIVWLQLENLVSPPAREK